MSSFLDRHWKSIAMPLMTVGVLLFLSNQLIVFPTFEYTSGDLERRLIPVDPYNEIAEMDSRFLWENRALDLISQSFVILAAVICCLAMIKPEKEESP